MPKQHIAEPGDCITSIAFAHGFFWKTLWDHPENADLKSKRGDPNTLEPGDRVVIPDLRLREEPKAHEKRHRFRLKTVPIKLGIRLLRPKPDQPDAPDSPNAHTPGKWEIAPLEPVAVEEEPFADTPFVAEYDGNRTRGRTDGDGRVELEIMPATRAVRLIIAPETTEEHVEIIQVGHLDPFDTSAGLRQRLQMLGYACDPAGPLDAPDLQEAVAAFQKSAGKPSDGRVSAELSRAVKDKFGC